MDYWRREQLGVASGIGAVVLFIIGLSLITSWPQPDATGEELRGFIVDSRTTLLVQSFLMAVAAMAGLWFFGSLRSILRRAEGGTGRVSSIAAYGGIVALVAMMGATAIGVGIANQITRITNTDVIVAFWHVSNGIFAFAAFPFIVAVAATSLVGHRTGLLPRWLVLGGALPIAGNALGALTMFSSSGAFTFGGDVTFTAIFLSAIAWILATSITLTIRLGRTEETAVARRRITDITTEPPRALER